MRPADIPLREAPVWLGGPPRLCASAPCCADIVPSASVRCAGGACGKPRALAGAAQLAVGCLTLWRPRVLDRLAGPAATLALRSGLKSVVGWRSMTDNTANMIGHANPIYLQARSVRPVLRSQSPLVRRIDLPQECVSPSAHGQIKSDQDGLEIHVRLGGACPDGQPIPSARTVDSAVERPWP